MEKFLEHYGEEVWHHYIVLDIWKHTDYRTFTEVQFEDFLHKRGLWVPKAKENLTLVKESSDVQCGRPQQDQKRSLIKLKLGRLVSRLKFFSEMNGLTPEKYGAAHLES